jgi:exosortase
VILAGILFYWFGQYLSLSVIGEASLVPTILSFVVSVEGAFILCFGGEALRRGRFAFLFLFLTVPLPTSVLNEAVYQLQSGSTFLAERIFQFLSVPVLRDNFVLYLPGLQIEVAKECSGIRSSTALLIIAIWASHVYLKQLWTKGLLLAVAAPLAIFKNSVRIVTLCLLALHVDPGFLSGRLHRDGGVVFFLFTLLLLGCVLQGLRFAEGSNQIQRSGEKLVPRDKADSNLRA